MAPSTVHLVTNSPLGDLPGIMGEIRAQYGDALRVHVFPVSVIDGDHVDEAALLAELRDSDVVLYDIRGNGRTYFLLKALYESSSVNICSILGGLAKSVEARAGGSPEPLCPIPPGKKSG